MLIGINGRVLQWKDAGIFLNLGQVVGVVERPGDNGKGNVLCGVHEGQPMSVEGSHRDWNATLDALRAMGQTIASLPLFDQDEEGAVLHMSAAHFTVIGQVPNEPSLSRVSLTTGTTFIVALPGHALIKTLKEATHQAGKRIAAAMSPGAAGPVQ